MSGKRKGWRLLSWKTKDFPPALELPGDVRGYVNDRFRTLEDGASIVLFLDKSNTLIGEYPVKRHGLRKLSTALNVWRLALIRGAVAIVIAKDHPAETADESAEDAETIKDMRRIGKMFGVTVLGDIITLDPTKTFHWRNGLLRESAYRVKF